MTQLLATLMSLFLSSQLALAADCTEYMKDFGQIHYYRLPFKHNKCFLDLSAVNPPNDLVYRSYLLTDEGVLMVFNSYGNGDTAEFTGARVFYFFPRTSIPDIEEKNQNLQINSASPQARFMMSSQTAEMVAMENGKIKVDPQVNSKNKGGFEILEHSGLLLDVGFAQGHDPTEDMGRISIFEDSAHQKCYVKNKEIFESQDQDFFLRFKTDLELSKFLKTRCPLLKYKF